MDNESKDVEFECPSCGAKLSVEPKSESDMEHSKLSMKPTKKENAGTMPMNKLRDKISSPPGMPPTVSNPPNLNAY